MKQERISMKAKKTYKKWSLNEKKLVRAAIINNAEDIDYLSTNLNRSHGSVKCQLGRERMALGMEPKYTGKNI